VGHRLRYCPHQRAHQISAADDTDELSVLDDRHALDAVPLHQPDDILERVLRGR
jgi:hypothetical protein